MVKRKVKMDLEELKDIEGTDEFPNNANDVYDLVETIAVQNIRALKSVLDPCTAC